MSEQVKSLCFSGLFVAIVAIATSFVQIPIPSSGGYVNIGDGVILFICFFFGRKHGVAAGGIGSMLADLFSPYAVWAIPTLVIKSAMALACCFFFDRTKPVLSMKNALGAFTAEVVMIVGYFFGGAIIYKNFLTPLESIVLNIVQAVAGIAIFFFLSISFKKISHKFNLL